MSVITCSYSEHNIRHLQNDDKGMTLLEVLGVLVVAAIVIGAVMGLSPIPCPLQTTRRNSKTCRQSPPK